MRLARTLVLVLLVAELGGCAFPGGGTATTPTATTSTTPPTDDGPPLTFGGLVVDALDGRAVAHADVRIDLAQTRPCRIEAIVWNAYPAPADGQGRFGPVTIPRPRSDDVAFYLHALAAGYSENATFFGPAQARGDLGNLTVVLHPTANVTGHAPPGTLVALDDARYPRIAVADERGAFAFEGARVLPTTFVAATDVPYVATVTAPEVVVVPSSNGTGWALEGRLQSESGAPMAGDVVAREDGALVGVARAGDSGVFVLRLPAHGTKLTLDARTAAQDRGATRVLDVQGPPATRETLILRALPC